MIHTIAMAQEESRWQRRPQLLIIGGAIILVTILHYLTSSHLLEYHTVYRSLYYLPIAGAAVTFGLRGGLLVALAAILLYLPHILGIGETIPGDIFDNVLELPVFLLIGGLVGWYADRERTQRQHTEQLRSYIDAVLQSLPVGVAIASPGAYPIPQNRVARNLFAHDMSQSSLSTLKVGYYSLELGHRPLGVYIAHMQGVGAIQSERVYVIEDLTEQRALEAQLRRVERLASVGQLAAGMAHEVRNPLAIVRATAQMLAAQRADDSQIQPYIQILTSEADRIEHLISDVLDYARPRPPYPVPLDLAVLLETVAQQVRPYAVQHGVQVIVSQGLIGFVAVDAAQFGQALLNLLLNAIQSSSQGSTVTLNGTCDTTGMTISVNDQGVGMLPEVLERACDPFFTTRPDGTGLGLSLVAAVVQEHGGSLQLTSTPGIGTQAHIKIPTGVS